MNPVWETFVSRSLQDRTIFLQLREHVDRIMFQDNLLGNIWELLCGFFDEYAKLPTLKEFVIWLRRLPAYEKERAGSYVERMNALYAMTNDVSNEVLLGEAEEAIRQYRIGQMLMNGTAMLEAGRINYDDMQRQMREILRTRLDMDLGMELNKDPGHLITQVLQDERYEPISSGIQGLDRSLGGGWFRGQILCGIGPPGVGKSTFLLNHAVGAVQEGYDVLLLTVELQALMVAERVIRRIAKRTREEMVREVRETEQWMETWFALAGSRFFLKYATPGTFTVHDLDAYLDRLSNLEGFVPDVVVVDYLDEMGASKDDRRRDLRHQHSGIARDLAGLAKERNHVAITMTQTNRAALGKKKLSEKDIGEDFGKIKIVDLSYAICQTQEEYDAKQARIRWLKMRDRPGKGREIPVYVDYELMTVRSLEQQMVR